MGMDSSDSRSPINKSILLAGKGGLPEFRDGAKVTFHFRTEKCDENNTVIDDSRKLGKPMELILGKKFRLEVWEACVKTMKANEVAEFTVDKSLVSNYPVVSKTLRTALGVNKGHSAENHKSQSHCCGMMALQRENLGPPELDELAKNPQDLRFIMELLQVEEPGEYKKESWAMDEEEKLNSIPRLREEGNILYKDHKYTEAARRYAEALGILEQLQLKEKPGDEEWVKLDEMKIPLLLNYSQCRLLQDDFYPVIEHTTAVLEKDPDNVKALFRRAKAHVGAWNPDLARKDFEKAKELDLSLQPVIDKELKLLDILIREKDEQDRKMFEGKMF